MSWSDEVEAPIPEDTGECLECISLRSRVMELEDKLSQLDEMLIVSHLGTLDSFDSVAEAVGKLVEFDKSVHVFFEKEDRIKELEKLLSAPVNLCSKCNAYLGLLAESECDTCKRIKELEAENETLSQQVCDVCSPDNYGWQFNAVEGKVPCVCIEESEAYQEAQQRIKELEGEVARFMSGDLGNIIDNAVFKQEQAEANLAKVEHQLQAEISNNAHTVAYQDEQNHLLSNRIKALESVIRQYTTAVCNEEKDVTLKFCDLLEALKRGSDE